MAATYTSGLSPLTEKLTIGVVRSFPRYRSKRFLTVGARSSEPRDGNVDDGSSLFEDDKSYVLKLGVGSLAGAAVVKYGSVFVPQFTRPNLAEALFIIITPVVAAALILFTKSRTTDSSPPP